MRDLSTRGALAQDRFPAAAGREPLANVFSRFCDSASTGNVGVEHTVTSAPGHNF